MATYKDVLAKYKKRHASEKQQQSATVAIKVIGWVEYDSIPDEGPDRIGGWGGFIQHGDRWSDYLANCDEPDIHLFEALRNEILRLKLKQGGDWHQNDPEGAPVFSDGSVGMFTFRAWGDIMAATWAQDDDRDYSYMDFYMGSFIQG